VVEGHAQLAVLWSTAGRTERAEREFLRALELFRPVVDQLPDLPEIRRQLGSILGDIATNLNVAGRPAEALGCVEEAIGHQSQVLARAPRDQVALNHLRRNHQQLASAWCALGRHVEAARSLDRLLERAGEDPEALFVAARTLARCVHVTEHDEELGPEDRRRMAGAYADRAVERLREAVRRGFRDQKRLRATPELKPLQDREDFRSLLESLAAR
jgi:tetratricopeptide (TPR) repeat protein